MEQRPFEILYIKMMMNQNKCKIKLNWETFQQINQNNKMSKSNQTTSSKPGFSTGGSFQALVVESIESDSESDSQTTPIVPSHRAPSTAISTSTKKGRAKQRARDRARKSANNSSLPDPTEDPPSVTTPNNDTTLRSGRTIPTPTNPKISSLPTKSIDSIQGQASESLRPSPPPPLPPPEVQSPTTSSSASMINSLSSSSSSTDLDDEEDDYEESAPSRAGDSPEDLKAHQSERDSTLVLDEGENGMKSVMDTQKIRPKLLRCQCQVRCRLKSLINVRIHPSHRPWSHQQL
ncbi:hypothetical protein DFH28DRAFT_306496 [Melampsora americana]|nr:hypothetical protein DFH28DRAFT_306496 [Melampsora americana]